MPTLSILTQLTQAIVALLEATTFSETVVITNKYPPLRNIWATRTMYIIVTPIEETKAVDTRNGDGVEYTIDITLTHTVNVELSADVDPISKVSEEVESLFNRVTLINDPQVEWKGVEEQEFVPDEGIRFRVTGKAMTLTYIRFT